MKHDRRACIVPGCGSEGVNKLGVRCRVWHDGPSPHGKRKTGALWAPDADAFLCDEHALGGATITLLYEPDGSRQTTVRVIGARHVEPRSVRIRGATSFSSAPSPEVSVRERATTVRKGVLASLAAVGARLVRISEAVYRHPSGSRIAMPFAREIAGSWWMGSYEGRFDEALLLCQVGDTTVAFHLPQKLLARHLSNLGRSGGRVIFHVDRHGGGFALRLLGGRSMPLKPFEPRSVARLLGGKS